MTAQNHDPGHQGPGRNSHAPLTIRHKAAYATGDIGDGIQGAVVNTFALFYLTSVCGLPGSLAGLALGISLVAEAITTPLFGYMSDNTHSRWGRRHPYLFLGSLPLALSVGMIFSIPAFDSTWTKFAYVLTVLIILRVSFSAFALPYAALGAELSQDYTERSVIMAYRNFFNICGTTACYILGFGIFMSGEAGMVKPGAYTSFGWVCALILFMSILISACSSLGLRHRLHQNISAEGSARSRFPGEVRNIFRNPSFKVLFLMILVFSTAQGIIESLSVHAFKYFWDLPTSVTNHIFIFRMAGMICGIPVYAMLLKRYEKRDILIMGMILISLIQFILPVLTLTGIMPEGGSVLYAILYVVYLVNGCLLTFLWISYGSMIADAADEHDFLFGVRREGFYFAGVIFAAKCALGLGAFIAGVSLEWIGFPNDLALNPDQIISTVTLQNLGLIFGPGASLIAFMAVVILFQYKLDRETHRNIRAELDKRVTA